MATRVTKHASPLLLERGVRGVAGEPMEIVVHLPTSPAVAALGFVSDKAFPEPGLLAAMPELIRHAYEQPEARLLLFGHADEAGSDAHNKKLSDRRAKVAFALLTQDLAKFDELAREDHWGLSQYQTIMKALGIEPMAVDGEPGPQTSKGTKTFQRAYNAGKYHQRVTRERAGAQLKVDGTLGPRSESALRDAYLAQVSTKLDPARFMGPKTAGCGEFNRIGSPEQDRRVVLALYRPDFPTESRIPCKDGDAGSCKINKKAAHPWKCNFYRRTLQAEQPLSPRAIAPLTSTLESDFALRLTEQFAQAMTVDAFALWGHATFGSDLPRSAFEALHADLRGGTLSNVPTRIVGELQGHLGAFDSASGAVLIAEEMVLAALDVPEPASTLSCVLVEEFGHYLDHLLRHGYSQLGGNGPEDEGAHFAALLLNEQLSRSDRFLVGTYSGDRDGQEVYADWGELKGALRDALSPEQQAEDERSGELAFSGAKLSVPSANEAQEVLYVTLLLAGSSVQEASALVELARKLQARWRGRAGSWPLYESSKPGKLGPDLERVLLAGLLRLYDELDTRIRAAPMAADGLPDLKENSWPLAPGESIWDLSSPLAGIADDIAPFGEKQDWVVRLQELAPQREARRRAVRERYVEFEPDYVPSVVDPETPTIGPGIVPGADAAAAAVAGGTPVDDGLNYADRTMAAVDTILEVAQIEILHGLALPLSGALLAIVTTLSGIIVADQRHAEAAKAVGILQAFFAVRQVATAKETPPLVMIVDDVERRAEKETHLRPLVNAQNTWRLASPQHVIDKGRRDGIRLVLDALEKELREVDRRAAHAFGTMILRVRVEFPNDAAAEERARKAYSMRWWKERIRRDVFTQVSSSIQKPALAVFKRLSPP